MQDKASQQNILPQFGTEPGDTSDYRNLIVDILTETRDQVTKLVDKVGDIHEAYITLKVRVDALDAANEDRRKKVETRVLAVWGVVLALVGSVVTYGMEHIFGKVK